MSDAQTILGEQIEAENETLSERIVEWLETRGKLTYENLQIAETALELAANEVTKWRQGQEFASMVLREEANELRGVCLAPKS